MTATESYKGPSQPSTKPAFSSKLIQLEPRQTKLVERFSELYRDDRLKTVKALKEMSDKSTADRMIYFIVEASVFEMSFASVLLGIINHRCYFTLLVLDTVGHSSNRHHFLLV